MAFGKGWGRLGAGWKLDREAKLLSRQTVLGWASKFPDNVYVIITSQTLPRYNLDSIWTNVTFLE